jgi:pimeloyl-ACP methyl ester carboxylesterase
MFNTTLSRDGTSIAFERYGSGGQPIIMVVGAFNERPTAAPLAQSLAPRFNAITYDRRGRGDSGDTLPFAVEREIEDIEALIAEVGGSAGLFGYSSGGMLALQATAAGLPISSLALYDPPYLVEALRTPKDVDQTDNMAKLIAAGRRGEAVEYFQRNVVGLPPDVIAQLRHAPFRAGLERIAHTLVYECAVLGDRSLPSPEAAARVSVPTLVIAGGAGFPSMPAAAEALASLLPNARARILPDQNHDIDAAVLGPELAEFFGRLPNQSGQVARVSLA